MAAKSDTIMNGFLFGAAFGVLAYYALPVLPGIGTSVGTAITGVLDSIGKSIITAVSKTASTDVLAYGGAMASLIVGGIIGIIVDMR